MTTLIADEFAAIAARMREIATGAEDRLIPVLVPIPVPEIDRATRWLYDSNLRTLRDATYLSRFAEAPESPPTHSAFAPDGCNVCLVRAGICTCPGCTEQRDADFGFFVRISDIQTAQAVAGKVRSVPGLRESTERVNWFRFGGPNPI